MKKYTRLSKYASITAYFGWGSQLLSLVLFGAWAYLVGPEIFAPLVILQSLAAPLRGLFQRASYVFLYRENNLRVQQVDALCAQQLVLSFMCGILLAVCAIPVNAYYDVEGLSTTVVLLACVCPVIAIGDFRATVLQLELRAKPSSYAKVAAQISQHSVSFCIYTYLDGGLLSLAYGFIAGAFIASVIQLLASWGKYNTPKLRFDQFRVAIIGLYRTISVRGYIFADSLLCPFRSQIDIYLLAPSLSLTTLGSYSLIRKIIYIARDITLRPIEALAIPALGEVTINSLQMASRWRALLRFATEYAMLGLICTVTVGVSLWQWLFQEDPLFISYAVPISIISGFSALTSLTHIVALKGSFVRLTLAYTIASVAILGIIYTGSEKFGIIYILKAVAAMELIMYFVGTLAVLKVATRQVDFYFFLPVILTTPLILIVLIANTKIMFALSILLLVTLVFRSLKEYRRLLKILSTDMVPL